MGKDGIVGEFDSDIEEGVGLQFHCLVLVFCAFQVPYITGNILWAVYQFIVFIVLLRYFTPVVNCTEVRCVRALYHILMVL